MPAHKIEIVFITVTDRVAVMTQHVHRPDPTPASMKVNRVLPARQPAAVTYGSNDAEHDRRLHKFMKVTREHGLVLNRKEV